MRDALGDVQSVLVLGGTSEIGLAIAAQLVAPRQAKVVLGGRHLEALERAATSLRAAGSRQCDVLTFDAEDPANHEAFVEKAAAMMGDFDVVILAFGVLGDQEADEAGGDGALRLARVNYVGAVSIGLLIARRLREQGHGTLVVLSSVAGERVRRSNFIYGSSKSGLDGFAQGLGDSLIGTGARVLIVRPGFVHTKMTAGIKAAPLSTTADAVAASTVTALRRGAGIVWVPGGLRWLMMAIRHLPRPVFRRLKV